MNNSTKKKFSGNNNRTFVNRKSKEEYEAEKAAKIALQTKNLGMIADIAEYLDDFIKSENLHTSMKDVLTHLTEVKGHAAEDTKAISQFSYILLELANARKNTRISGDRLNIRVMYIEERLKTSFKRELHEKIVDMIKAYDNLFKWDADAEAKDYDTVEDSASQE